MNGANGCPWWLNLILSRLLMRMPRGEYLGVLGFRRTLLIVGTRYVDVTVSDNVKSVCLIYAVAFRPTGFRLHGIQTDSEALNFAATDSGNTARGFLSGERNVGQVGVSARFELAPVLPSPTSNDEPTWLTNCRQAIKQERLYEPNEGDKEVLSKISHFDFGVKEFHIYCWLL